MQFRLHSNKVPVAAIVLALFVFVAMVVISFRQTQYANNTAASVAHTQEELYATVKVLSTVTDNETGSRGFILTGRPDFLEPLEKSKKNILTDIAALKLLVADNAKQIQYVDSLLFFSEKRMMFSDSTVVVRRQEGLAAAVQLVSTGRGKFYVDNIRRIISNMQDEANDTLRQSKAENSQAIAIEKIILLAATFAILTLMVIIFWKEGQRIEQNVQRDAEKQLALLSRQINLANDAIYTMDADRKIKNWNKGAENLYGFTKEEVYDKEANTILQTAITNEEINNLLKNIAREDHVTREIKRKTKSGNDIYVHISTTTIRDENKNITGYISVNLDITAQNKLRSEIDHLASIVEQSSEAIFSKGTDQRIISWNKGSEKLFGFTKEEAINKTATELGFITLTPEEIAAAEKQITEKGNWKSERDFINKNGTSFFGAVTGDSIINDNGETSAFYFIVKDISLRKKLEEKLKQANEELEEKVKERTKEVIKTEQRFRALIENNYDIITLMDASFKVFYRSPSAARITGWSDAEMLQSDGENKMAIHPDDHEKANSIMKECIANPGKPVYAIYRNRHKKGHYIWLEGAVTNLLHDPSVNAILFNFRDVSERIAAAEEITSSEIRFRSLIENSVEGISLLDENSNVIYRSPSAFKIIGNNPMQNTISYAHPDDAAHFKNKFAETLRKPGIPVPYRVKYLHPDGYHFWAEGTFTNLLHVNGVNAVVANYHDITDKVKAEAKLESSEQRFRALVEKNKDIITLMDASFNVIYRSPSTYRITGWSNEEMININGAKNIHPDDLEYFNGIIKEIMANPDKTINTSFRSRHKKGHYLWLEGTLINMLQQEHVKAIVFNSRDVTERIAAEEKLKASEEQFRHSMDNMLEGVQIHDFNWRYIYVNNALVKYSTYAKDELLGHTLMEKYPGIEQTVLFKTLNRCMTERVAEHFETEFIFPNGTKADYELSIQPIPEGIFILSIDITERKRAAEAIRRMNAELEERVHKRTAELKKANEELEAFSYSVSHDLRAPLRAIIGFSSILEEDYSNRLDDEARRITGIIKSNTTKMGNLIDDLLTFSRMGRHEILRSAIDTTEMVQEIIRVLSGNGGGVIKWTVHDLPVANADASMMRQVWINLITNAVKYSGNSIAPEIQIGSFKENNMLVFFVEDNGVGFDEKYKNKLFKVFQRLHSAEEFEGTGIGLAIVEKIVSKHGGLVWAEAEVNKGASFYFSLPDN